MGSQSEVVDVLLVEDSADDAELACRSLAASGDGPRIHRVEDGAEALEFLFAEGRYEDRAAQPPPKVVLLDLNLPFVPGLEVLRKMRAADATCAIPVVALTSSRDQRDVAEAYALGVNSYVVKPLDFGTFSDALQAVGRYWMALNEPPAGG